MPESLPCPFCSLPSERVILSTPLALAFADGFPVSQGHTLIVPRRHVGSFFELDAQEREAVMGLLLQARQMLLRERKPDGFNVGLNDGIAAGQTVMHAHLHLIPRYAGDLPDPRGGVRWVMPARADYWSGR